MWGCSPQVGDPGALVLVPMPHWMHWVDENPPSDPPPPTKPWAQGMHADALVFPAL